MAKPALGHHKKVGLVMRFSYRAIAVAVPAVALLSLGAAAPALATPGHGGGHSSYFTLGSGTASWVAGNDSQVPSDTDGKVLQLSSPDGASYAGVAMHALDGVAISDISNLSFDYASPNYTGAGGGSPRLVVRLSDGGRVLLNPVVNLSSTWTHMDAVNGNVDNQGGSGGACGTYQITWSAAVACHAGATVTEAYILNDSGWAVANGLTVLVDNMTLNNTVYSVPGDVAGGK